MAEPLISILIPTIPERHEQLGLLLGSLMAQRRVVEHGRRVEVVTFGDTFHRSIGAKRNALLDLAQGHYLAFVDDDDFVSPHYLYELIPRALDEADPDVVVFDQECRIDNGPPIHCVYGIEYDYVWDGGPLWTGKPAHTMLWRSAIAKRHRFPDKMVGEDTDWAKACSAEVKTQLRIDRTLYHYHFSSEFTASRRQRAM